jgi:exo-beta-1,3-glucanase (GH17 family)
MAITVNWYLLGLKYLLDTPADLEGVTVNLALVTDAYTPNRDTDEFRNIFTGSELANGNGYTTGGVTATTRRGRSPRRRRGVTASSTSTPAAQTPPTR